MLIIFILFSLGFINMHLSFLFVFFGRLEEGKNLVILTLQLKTVVQRYVAFSQISITYIDHFAFVAV